MHKKNACFFLKKKKKFVILRTIYKLRKHKTISFLNSIYFVFYFAINIALCTKKKKCSFILHIDLNMCIFFKYIISVQYLINKYILV